MVRSYDDIRTAICCNTLDRNIYQPYAENAAEIQTNIIFLNKEQI